MKPFRNSLKSTQSFMVMIILIMVFSALACSESSSNRTAPKRIAFIADKDTDNVWELYVVKPDGTDLVKASGPMVDGGYVSQFWWSPDGSKIAYRADQDTDNVSELYVVNADGSGWIKVSGTMVAGGEVFPFDVTWSPDGSKIAYLANQDTDTVGELYVVNADGSGLVKVNGTLVAGGDVEKFSWSPDSSKIVYQADQDTDGIWELYVVNPDGSGRIKVNGTLVAGGRAINPAWSPDGSKIVYIADQDTDNVYELYVVNPDGSGRIKVSGIMVAGGGVGQGLNNVTWSPDSSKIAYRADQDTDEVNELYVVNADGSGLVKVSGTMNGDVAASGTPIRWSSDSSKIAYLADQDTAGVLELYVVNADGTGLVKVSGEMVSGGDVINMTPNWGWFPDDSKIVYLADQDTDEVYELYVVNADGSGLVKVSGTMVAGGTIEFNFLSSDGRKIMYYADQDTDGVWELYVVNPDGSGLIKVNGTLVSGGDINGSCWSPDGSKIAYSADQDTDGVIELYVVNPDGSGLVKVSGTLVAGGNVDFFNW